MVNQQQCEVGPHSGKPLKQSHSLICFTVLHVNSKEVHNHSALKIKPAIIIW
jgi:hypothetical protein